MELQDKKIDMGCGADNFDGYLHLDKSFHSSQNGRALIFRLRKI